MDSLPIFFLLKDQPCLVVGGGLVAARKLERLTKTGARVTVVATDFCETLLTVKRETEFVLLQKEFSSQDLDNKKLVIAATSDPALNLNIAKLAKAQNIPVNVVNQPEAGTFIMPSVIERGPVVIAISTSGTSPILARLLRARLEAMIPTGFGRIASMVSRFRKQAAKRFPDINQRRRFWERVLCGDVAELLYTGQEKRAEQKLKREFSLPDNHSFCRGEVYIVGGGPGDPDLLTFKALRLMQQADVVLYDRLVAPTIVELVNRSAERIYVGKERSNHSLSQLEINQLLVDLAKQGKRVLRLKGGDPFIFGRGGEEMGLLADSQISFQVVPGITSASGCSAYAGIPLTHRDYARSCLFVTGHLKNDVCGLNWSALVQPLQTLCIYMGTHGLGVISKELIRHGMDPLMPAAIIHQGTTNQQRVYTATVATLAELPDKYDIKPPNMVIIGKVVRLRDRLNWFEPD